MEFLHFSFNLEPRFFEGELTDIFYTINYHEIGSGLSKQWIKKFDGHLIDSGNLSMRSQWKGPFGGIRDVKYKFYLELVEDPSSPTDRSVYISIFSTDPESDAEYYNSFYEKPFEVMAYYYNTEEAKVVLNSYSILSTIRAIYQIGTSLNPTVKIVTAIGGAAVTYAVDTYISNLPANIEIRCGNCDTRRTIRMDGARNFDYVCDQCGRRARITFN
ncbi:hypothetical protein ACFL4U_03815 [Candidatus Neomarinimicrobiota bacterium]